jgi:hypothetical protein
MKVKCSFFEQGKCKKGDDCEWSHVVCQFITKKVGCKNGKKCKYVHPVSTKTGDDMVVEEIGDCD